METAAFKYCFGNSYSTIENIFKTFPKECILELSFNKLPDELFATGIFKDEYLEKILTSFATFKQKLLHNNVQNHFQAIGSREIELAKIPHKNGFIKCFLETPLPQEFDLLKISQNVLYVRRISLSINIGNWEISKVVKIASQVKDHKKLIWKYGIEDVLNPQIFSQVYYKFSYCGPKEDITKSFISVLSNIFPRSFRVFDEKWYSINQIINIDSLEPSFELFKGVIFENEKYEKLKYSGPLKTVIEYKGEMLEVSETFTRIKETKFKGLRVFKCSDDKIISVLYNDSPNEPLPMKLAKGTRDNNTFILKNSIKNELIMVSEEKTIRFMMKNGYLYLKGTKNNIISRDSITNPLSMKHVGYSLLDVSIGNDKEVFILFYLPFNHKPYIKGTSHDGFVKCRLNGFKYEIIEYCDDCDTYKNGLDIAIANYVKNIKAPRCVLSTKPLLNQFVYETFLNNVQTLNVIMSIDDNVLVNPEIIKRLCDVNSVFLLSSDKVTIGEYIRKISNSINIGIPSLINLSTKIYNKQNVDISVLNKLENIFTFSNFYINSINAIVLFSDVSDAFVEVFESLYKNIISEDCVIVILNEKAYKKFSKILSLKDTITFCETKIRVMSQK